MKTEVVGGVQAEVVTREVQVERTGGNEEEGSGRTKEEGTCGIKEEGTSGNEEGRTGEMDVEVADEAAAVVKYPTSNNDWTMICFFIEMQH